MNNPPAVESLDEVINRLAAGDKSRDAQIREIASTYASAVLAEHESLPAAERVDAVQRKLFCEVQLLAMGILRQRVAPDSNGVTGLLVAMLTIGGAHWAGASIWKAIYRERGSGHHYRDHLGV